MVRLYTPWFKKGEKPWRVGVYEVKNTITPGRFFQFWNGEFWGLRCAFPALAASFSAKRSEYQRPVWRGFRSEQKS